MVNTMAGTPLSPAGEKLHSPKSPHEVACWLSQSPLSFSGMRAF